MKKGLFLLGIVALIGVIYVVYTLNSGAELNEASPLVDTTMLAEKMDAETRSQFMEELKEMEDIVIEMSDPMPSSPELVAQGEFMRAVHAVEGQALLIEDDDTKTLRFENFESDNGPNLHIYLATDTDASDYIDLGPIKATKGNVNYMVDKNIDTDKYDKVLVWCVPFKVLFSYADLN